MSTLAANDARPGSDVIAPTGSSTIQLTSRAGIGSTVAAEDLATGATFAFRLVEPHEAAPKEGRLSIDSPVGMVLRARRPGEVVTASTPQGHRRLRVLSVS